MFDEFRIGLDHIAFGCASREELESWPARLDALGIEHGEILDRSFARRHIAATTMLEATRATKGIHYTVTTLDGPK